MLFYGMDIFEKIMCIDVVMCLLRNNYYPIHVNTATTCLAVSPCSSTSYLVLVNWELIITVPIHKDNLVYHYTAICNSKIQTHESSVKQSPL